MILPEKDAERVVGLFDKLDRFTDSHLDLKTDIPPQGLSTEQRQAIREQFYAHPEVLAEFLRRNPDNLSLNDLKLLETWKGRLPDRYMVVKHLKVGSVMVSGQNHYQVLGLKSPVEEMLFGRRLPVMVDATLLPYGNVIINDGLIGVYSVFFGPGTRSNLNADYSLARRQGRVHASFFPAETPAKPAQTGPSPHREAVLAMAAASDKLRGPGPRPLHSPTLAMLRWATQLAANCLQDRPDLGELRKQLTQIRKADKEICRICNEEL